MEAIFSFDERTVVYAWWLVGKPDHGDMLACLYRTHPGGELRLTWRFRSYVSDDPHDARDAKEMYDATWPADFFVCEALNAARSVAMIAAALMYDGAPVDEITVDGNAAAAFEKLLKHPSAHAIRLSKGGQA